MEFNNDKYVEFIDTITEKNSKKIIYFHMKEIDRQNIELESITDFESLEKMILSLKINNLNSLASLKQTLLNYSRFIGDMKLFKVVDSIDCYKEWGRIKSNAKPSILSINDMEQIYNKIAEKARFAADNTNDLYIVSLLMAIFEGIWESDFEVISNLRGSDIHGNMVTLRYSDGTIRDFQISETLANNMMQLTKKRMWHRINGNSDFYIPISGKYPDSVFKVEFRKGSNSDIIYSSSYKRKIRSAIKDYANLSISPTNLYMSGIIYRVSELLKEKKLSLQSVLENNTTVGTEIIKKELIRCNYNGRYYLFKKFVNGHVFL